MKTTKLWWGIVVILLACSQVAIAQLNVKDSVPKESFVERMQAFAIKSAKESKAEFEADKALIDQNAVIEEIKHTTQLAKSFLRNGLDSLAISTHLESVKKRHEQAGDGVFNHVGTAQTTRNLTTTYNILTGLSNETAAQKNKVDRYQSELIGFRFALDSLLSDRSLFKFPTDSSDLAKYIERLRAMAVEVSPVSKELKKNIATIQHIQTQINLELFKITSHMEEIDFYQKQNADRTFKREFVNIWEKNTFDRPFSEIVYFSILKLQLTLMFYLQSNWGKLSVIVLLVMASTRYISLLKRSKITSEPTKGVNDTLLVTRSPFLSGIILVLSIFQFIFLSPPFAFSAVIWLLAGGMLSVVFSKYVSSYWWWVWIAILILFAFSCFDNLLLQASRVERWIILVLSGAAALLGIIVLGNKKRHAELREQWILYPVGLMACMAVGAFIADIFGRYNLAKVLLVAGLLNVVIAILFLWVVRLINEGLQLASAIYTHQERRLFYINYNRLGTKAPAFFYALLVVGWFVLFGRNFYEFRQISEPLKSFFVEEHTLGSYTFSISNLVVFFLIMILTTLVSKVVSYFAGDSQVSPRDQLKKGFKIGSWILIIRITIIVIGLFLAFAAIGIPMDKITIVVGALGVGIGFGLQTLVNNLVSGLIIAFEKPVNVGDLVEVSGQGGVVKSIGFRSSVIATLDGADLVLPNGDLLNSHVVNWTQGGQRKRMNITIGVAYDSDLKKARALLLELFESEDRILKSPEPSVQYSQFADSSIDINLHFWVRSLKDAGQIRSDIMEEIHRRLQENGIVIPFPQRELLIRTTGDKRNEKEGDEKSNGVGD